MAVRATFKMGRGHLTSELQFCSACIQGEDMYVDNGFEAPVPDDLRGNLDDLLPDKAEDQG